MPKQGRPRAPTGPPPRLIDLWRGDTSETIAAFLPLKAIATMAVSRRFRDRHPAILFSVARRHGALAAGTSAFLDAVVAKGRDWRCFSSDAADNAWTTIPASLNDNAFTCSTNTSGGARHIQISTRAFTGHGGGLVRNFDHAEHMCLRRVKYRFSFSDPAPDASHEEPDIHGLAYFNFAGAIGLFVRPTRTGYYALRHCNGEESAAIAMVEPDTWYEVKMKCDWTRTALGYDTLMVHVVIKGGNQIKCRSRLSCDRLPLRSVALYNSSPGVARYAGIELRYSEKTPHDRRFAFDDLSPAVSPIHSVVDSDPESE